MAGDERCVQLLLAAGADAAAADARGRLPAELAPSGGAQQGQAAKALALLNAAAPHRSKQARAGSAPSSATSATAVATLSPQQAFAALPQSERISKAGRWAALSGDDLEA